MELDMILDQILSLIRILFYLVCSAFIVLIMKGSEIYEEQENEEIQGQESLQEHCTEQENHK